MHSFNLLSRPGKIKTKAYSGSHFPRTLAAATKAGAAKDRHCLISFGRFHRHPIPYLFFFAQPFLLGNGSEGTRATSFYSGRPTCPPCSAHRAFKVTRRSGRSPSRNCCSCGSPWPSSQPSGPVLVRQCRPPSPRGGTFLLFHPFWGDWVLGRWRAAGRLQDCCDITLLLAFGSIQDVHQSFLPRPAGFGRFRRRRGRS